MLDWLADVVDVDRYEVPVVGPRGWWAGPLNVEALALESVQCALTAANALGSDRATDVRAELVAANFDSLEHLRVGGRKPTMFAAMSGYSAAPTAGCARTRASAITRRHSDGPSPSRTATRSPLRFVSYR